MKCPLCKSGKSVEIEPPAGARPQIAYECGECGCTWTVPGEAIRIIKGGAQPQQKVCTDFVCPTCKSMVSHETDLNAFQFHEELYECTVCGTTSSIAHGQVAIVQDSQAGTFLDSGAEDVEADDYNTL